MKYIRTYEKHYTGVSAGHVWEIMTDINNWKDWHPGIDSTRMEKPFEVGNTFTLTPRGKQPVTIKIIDIQPGLSFTDRTDFPGAQMFDTHTLTPTHDGVIVSNTLVMKGMLRWVWMWLVGKKVAESIPQKTDTLVAIARKKAGITHA